MESLALADLKKRNAAKLDAKNQEQLLEMGREVPGEIKPQEGKNFDAFHLELECVEKGTPNMLNHAFKQGCKWNLNWAMVSIA